MSDSGRSDALGASATAATMPTAASGSGAGALEGVVFVMPTGGADSPYNMSFVKRLARGIEALGVRVHVHPVGKSGSPVVFIRQGRALRRVAREAGAGLVVAQYGTYTGLLTALFAPCPVVVTFRGSDLNPSAGARRWMQSAKHAFSHVASYLADGIVCVSEELAGRLRVRRPLAVIPSPTDLDLFEPRDRTECREALGWPLDARIAVFLPGAHPTVKGAPLAREVQALLRRRTSPVRLEIVDGTIPLEEVVTHLNAADALLFLSRYEGSPNLVREACACNLPVVSTRVGDVESVLRGVEPSRIVDRDPDAVAVALEEVAALGVRSNGRKRVSEFATPAISARSLAFYREVLTVGRKAGRT